jgi:ribosomal protein L32
MGDDAASKRSHEQVTSDHYPSCPRCGNICGVAATKCWECGARLLPTLGDYLLAGERSSAAVKRAAAGGLEDAERERER